VTPTLIGYFPKRRTKRPEWLNAPRVDELSSVSTCFATAPSGWIEHWRHNELWVYDTPDIALSVVPADARSEFDLYAYRMFPLQIADTQDEPFPIPALAVEPMASGFQRLGYDIVTRAAQTSFECSPLSCNHMAEHTPTNRYCLLDDAETAFQLARTFEGDGCEPGPYHIIEVWRQTPNAV
jgi:hypothetical protein